MNKENDPPSQSQIPQQRKRKCHTVKEAHISEEKVAKIRECSLASRIILTEKKKG